MPDIELVATDLDGSLWWLDDHVPDATLAAWARIEAAGVHVLVATGRREERARTPLAAVDLAPPAVVLNGGLGLHLGSGKRFWRSVYDTDSAAAVLAAFRSHGVQPCMYVDRTDGIQVFVDPAPSTDPAHLVSFGPSVRTDDLDRVAAEEDVLGFSVVDVAAPELVAVAADLVALAQPHLSDSIPKPGTRTLTVAPRGQSKWNGIEAYCQANGLDPERVLCVGDGPNDLEMLEAAAVAAVPESASTDALAVADVTIGHPAQGGWADIEAHL